MGDVAGAKEDDVIAGLGERCGSVRQILRPLHGKRLAMAARFQRGDETVAIGALDRRLAGRIDIGDDHRIGIVEAARKFVEERDEPRIAMRLHDSDDLALVEARAARSTAAISTG